MMEPDDDDDVFRKDKIIEIIKNNKIISFYTNSEKGIHIIEVLVPEEEKKVNGTMYG